MKSSHSESSVLSPFTMPASAHATQKYMHCDTIAYFMRIFVMLDRSFTLLQQKVEDSPHVHQSEVTYLFE